MKRPPRLSRVLLLSRRSPQQRVTSATASLASSTRRRKLRKRRSRPLKSVMLCPIRLQSLLQLVRSPMRPWPKSQSLLTLLPQPQLPRLAPRHPHPLQRNPFLTNFSNRRTKPQKLRSRLVKLPRLSSIKDAKIPCCRRRRSLRPSQRRLEP